MPDHTAKNMHLDLSKLVPKYALRLQLFGNIAASSRYKYSLSHNGAPRIIRFKRLSYSTIVYSVADVKAGNYQEAMTREDAPKPITRAKTIRRDRILDAAERLFAQVGLRSATMEAIAAASSVSKATLYAYFPDKMEVFSAVASRLANDMQSGVIAALEEKGSLVDRLSNALMAKHGRAFDAAIGSPHRLELLDTRRHEFGQLFNAMDRAIEEAIFQALKAAGASAPRDDARLIFCASIGISEQAKTREVLEMDLRRLVSAMLSEHCSL